MKLISLNCRQCGAPLSVPEDVKHVTCGHCGTQLAVVHEGGAFYTEKLAQLDQCTSEIETQLEDLQQQRLLDALEREWEVAQKSFLVYGNHGTSFLPTKKRSIQGIVFFGLIGVVPPVMAWASGLPVEAVLSIGFGCGFGGLMGVVVHVFLYFKASALDDAEARYHQRRAKLFEQ